tara:strand:+ start:3567 stop:3806 length:240 start_codon:yes stop_codon:yes gene_type:complete
MRPLPLNTVLSHCACGHSQKNVNIAANLSKNSVFSHFLQIWRKSVFAPFAISGTLKNSMNYLAINLLFSEITAFYWFNY